MKNKTRTLLPDDSTFGDVSSLLAPYSSLVLCLRRSGLLPDSKIERLYIAWSAVKSGIMVG
jgi:hypothetical protein